MTKDKEEKPVGAVRGDVAPVVVDVPEVVTTPEQDKDAEKRADLIEDGGDSKDSPKHTTDHIPNYGQTHATPGIPFSENPLNPGRNPEIISGPDPEK